MVAQDLAFRNPAVVQGMYIFKQPRIGAGFQLFLESFRVVGV